MRRLLFKEMTLLCLFFLLGQILFGAEFPILYRLGIEKGLSNNSVRCVYQDHRGFMWFGTYDGLNRYDGYSFRVFRNKLNDPTSLPHNYIYTISEDVNGNLLVGTGQGLCMYNNASGTFAPAFYLLQGTQQKRKITANVTTVINDPDSNLVICTNGEGLLFQQKGQSTAIQVPIRKSGVDVYRYSVLVTVDNQQRIWLLVPGFGLCTFDPEKKEIRLVNPDLNSGHVIAADGKGSLWIGGATGVSQYAISTNKVEKLFNEQGHQLTSNNVMCMLIDRDGRVWAGTEERGVNIIDPASGNIEYLLPGDDQNSLSSESVLSIFEDREARKWIGTDRGGIDIVDAHKRSFRTIAHDPLNKNSLINNFVDAFLEEEPGKLWIGTNGGGLSIWNRTTNTFTNYEYQPGDPSSLSNNSVTSIKKDYLGNIWLSTYGGGIEKFNKAKGVFESYTCFNPETGKENKIVWQLYEDRDRNLWATTFSSGKLYFLNRQQNKFEVFDQQLYDLVSITDDHFGNVWAGDSHELVKINKTGRSYVKYEIGKPVRCIYEDSKDRLWLGTEGGGLLLFDRSRSVVVQQFSDADGLSNNSVLNIQEDGEGNLWLSTFNGLSRFNYDKRAFKNFYHSDGLQSNQFIYSAGLRLHSGELAFGGINGMNIFFPDSIPVRNFMPPVRLTSILVDNKPPGMDGGVTTQVEKGAFSEITVPYNDAVFSFEFASLEFSSPEKIKYGYILEGWDKGWNYTRSVRTVNYSSLREGSYIFRVKATNAEGAWNKEEARLQIIVLPPWYRTWWAYLAYGVMIMGACYFYIQHRHKQTRLEYEVQIAKLNAENERVEREKSRAELEKQRVITETEREINEKRLSFFANISHEFRTPLSLVINPVKELLDKEEEEGRTSEPSERDSLLKGAYRNARRMLSLVDQLLLFRKAESDLDPPRFVRVDLHAVAREVYLYFRQQASAREIRYQFECPDEPLPIIADRDKMEIILYNLLSNAFKYTPDGGAIVLRIVPSDASVEIMVKDSGAGIDPSAGDKIFDRFYQAPNAKAGFGIGLYMVKHFVEAHDGMISYETGPGKGTCFFISLSANKQLLTECPIGTAPETHEPSLYLPELDTPPPNPLADPLLAPLEDTGASPLFSERKSILLIDDSEEIRVYLAHIFGQGFKVYQAASGEEGLQLARSCQPDIIISDIVMKGLDGIELCRTIKQDSALSHIPVVLLTGDSRAGNKLKGVEGGADDYITKPFEKELLVARVQNLLKTRNNLQRYFYNEVTLQQNTLKISEEYKEFLDRCIGLVEKHLEDDEFSAQTFAVELGMSYSKVYKKIKTVSGQPINAFIRFIRLRKAAELFINTNYNVSETAFQVGMKDIKHFREHFHKLFGMNPSEFIEKYRNTFGKNYMINEKIVRP